MQPIVRVFNVPPMGQEGLAALEASVSKAVVDSYRFLMSKPEGPPEVLLFGEPLNGRHFKDRALTIEMRDLPICDGGDSLRHLCRSIVWMLKPESPNQEVFCCVADYKFYGQASTKDDRPIVPRQS